MYRNSESPRTLSALFLLAALWGCAATGTTTDGAGVAVGAGGAPGATAGTGGTGGAITAIVNDIDLRPIEFEMSSGGGQTCFPSLNDPASPTPNYDQFSPIVGKHCLGTNHQAIQGVQRVAFLGDSVTVGTPNLQHLLSIDNGHFWRNKLADWLIGKFGVNKGNDLDYGLWRTYDYFSGKGGKVKSGALWNCSKWGGRTDDLLEGGKQLAECFPSYPAKGADEVTLVVFTLGGNDISAMTKKGVDAPADEVNAGYPAAWQIAKDTIFHLENGLKWLKDPAMFPNGVYVVFANPFEFTDGTGKTDACVPQSVLDVPGIGKFDLSKLNVNMAELAGFKPWAKPEIQAKIVLWMLEEYMRLAVKYQVDLVWMLENFCGHGYVATGPNADPKAVCYLGPDAELWFDDTCTHPNDAGHGAIFNMFRAVIEE